MKKFAIRNIERPEAKIVEEYERLGASTVYEAQNKQGLMNDSLKPRLENKSIAGPAVTVTCHAGDNTMIHAGIEMCKPGDILVVSVIGEAKCGMMGDLIVSSLMKRGVKGVIIDNGIRDLARIREMDFPVWSKYVTPQGTTKIKSGWVNNSVICGEVQVMPGDLIVADDDGVVVVKKENIQKSLELSLAREAKEKITIEKINRGELSLDFYNLRTMLEEQGVVYCDSMEDLN